MYTINQPMHVSTKVFVKDESQQKCLKRTSSEE